MLNLVNQSTSTHCLLRQTKCPSGLLLLLVRRPLFSGPHSSTIRSSLLQSNTRTRTTFTPEKASTRSSVLPICGLDLGMATKVSTNDSPSQIPPYSSSGITNPITSEPSTNEEDENVEVQQLTLGGTSIVWEHFNAVETNKKKKVICRVSLKSAFSARGQFITHHRNRLHPKTLEALMCGQGWIWATMMSENDNNDYEISYYHDAYGASLEDEESDDGENEADA